MSNEFCCIFIHLPTSLAAASTCANCLGSCKSVCEATYDWSHAFAIPWECSPQINAPLFSPKTEFQSNSGQFHDIPCLTVDSIYIGCFHNSEFIAGDLSNSNTGTKHLCKSSTFNTSNKSKDAITPLPYTDGSLHDPANPSCSPKNPAICSLALLSPVKESPQQSAARSNPHRTNMILFWQSNKTHEPIFPPFCPSCPLSIYPDGGKMIHARCSAGP